MLEHDATPPEQEQAASLCLNPYDTSLNPNVLKSALVFEESGLKEKWIEDYLDHIYAPMVGMVPYRKRQEIRAEMRLHIGQLIAAHEELGSDPEEATQAALRQFGPPETVTTTWLNALPEEAISTFAARPAAGSVVHALQYASGRLAIAVGAWTLGIALLDRALNNGVSTSLYLALGSGLPMAVGYLSGRRHRGGRPVLSMLIAQSVVLTAWPFSLMFLMQALHHMNPEFRTAAAMSAVSFLALAPTGCLGAWLGSRRSRVGRRKSGVAAN